MSNGNYVVNSKYWNNATIKNAGAVTFGNGITGVTGTVSAANSLVGTSPNEFVGFGGNGNGVTALTNGNYVVVSADWNNGAVYQAGTVTFGNGTTGISGNLTVTNSVAGQAGEFAATTPFNNILTVTVDNAHNAVYAVFIPQTGLDHVYRGSTATGFSSAH